MNVGSKRYMIDHAVTESSLALLQSLLDQGEGLTVEFKAGFGREAMETLAAFANAKGGTLVIGVNDARHGIKDISRAEEPRFDTFGSFFKVTLFPLGANSPENKASKAVGEVNEGVSEGVSEGVNSLRKAIVNNPGQRAPFYGRELKTSVKNIERWLNQLKAQKQVEFRGAPRTGGYFPRNQEPQE